MTVSLLYWQEKLLITTIPVCCRKKLLNFKLGYEIKKDHFCLAMSMG